MEKRHFHSVEAMFSPAKCAALSGAISVFSLECNTACPSLVPEGRNPIHFCPRLFGEKNEKKSLKYCWRLIGYVELSFIAQYLQNFFSYENTFSFSAMFFDGKYVRYER